MAQEPRKYKYSRTHCHITTSGDLQGSGGFSVTSALSASQAGGGLACYSQHVQPGVSTHESSETPEELLSLPLSDIPSLAECVLWVLAVQDFQYAKESWPLLLQLFLKCSVSVVTLCMISETAATDGKSPKCKSC